MRTLRTKTGERIADLRGFRPTARKPWCLLASRSEAVAYRDLDRQFWFVRRLHHPDGSLTETQLDSDKPGRGYSSASGTIHHALDRRSRQHEQVAREFAQKIGAMLETAVENGEFTELVLAAEPHFLGSLRNAIPPRVRALVRHEINREFSNGSSEELRARIFRAMDNQRRREAARNPELEAPPEKKPGPRFFRKPGRRKNTQRRSAISSSL